jgi:hypothetical protein
VAHQVHATITTAPNVEAIDLDGLDVGRHVSGFTLQMRASELPKLTLDMSVAVVTKFDGDVQASVDPATHQALIQLGWTPPGVRDELRRSGRSTESIYSNA